MNKITKLSIAALAVIALVLGTAGCSPATPAQATSPGPGSYDTAPLNVQLRNGSTTSAESVIDDVITSSRRFEVVWRVVNIRENGTITIGCSGQVEASDIHMLVYSNGNEVSNEAGIESTCSVDPGYSVVLQPDQSLSLFAQFAKPQALGSQIEIKELSHASSLFNPYGSYKDRSKVTPTVPQWMLPIVQCVLSFFHGHKGDGINDVVGTGTLPFGISALIQEYGNKPPPYSLAGFYDVFRQLPITPYGACLPSIAQIQQWLNENLGILGPGTPGPPAPVATMYSGYTTPFAPTYYDAGAEWSVPHDNCTASPSSSDASQWVGLGGVSGPRMPSNPLVQAGVESHCILGRQINQPFWEVVPADTASNPLPGRTVNAGDQMTASIEYLGGGKYFLYLGDSTQNWSWSRNLSTGADSLPTTADWIVEAGTIDIPLFGQIAALADFGSVTFQAVSYTTQITGCVLQCGVLLGTPGHDRTVPYEVVIGQRQLTTVSQASPTGQFTITYNP